MTAKDIMTWDVVSVNPQTRVDRIAALLLEHQISGVPVVDPDRRVLGVVSEGDLMHWGEPTPRPSWWLTVFADVDALASRFVKTHGVTARDVMTHPAITVTEDTRAEEIAQLLEEKRIKRVPVVRDGRLVGIVSRADLIRGLATRGLRSPGADARDDRAIRDQLLTALRGEPWADIRTLSIVVDHGIVHLWGLIRTEAQREALRVEAENPAGVRGVEDHLLLWRQVGPDI